MKYRELVNRYKGYRILLTGWDLKKRAPGYGLSKFSLATDWNNVEIEEYEVDDRPSEWRSLTNGKHGVHKGTVWARVKTD